MRVFRALVVDDEPAARSQTIRALSGNGFQCDSAGDGKIARELIAASPYDAVVTELHVPEMNGHALAIDLLSRAGRPIVVVLTGVTEPKLATDLIARGVDDILFKPVDPSILGAKVRALVNRRAAHPAEDRTAVVALASAEPAPTLPTTSRVNAELTAAKSATKEPQTQAKISVLEMIRAGGTFDSEHIFAAIQQNAVLAAEVLKVASSRYYNPSGQRLDDLKVALARIGLSTIAEIASTMSDAAPE
ncbi:MAG TPA: response regulator [Planctomycetaceae bacterium]